MWMVTTDSGRGCLLVAPGHTHIGVHAWHPHGYLRSDYSNRLPQQAHIINTSNQYYQQRYTRYMYML